LLGAKGVYLKDFEHLHTSADYQNFVQAEKALKLQNLTLNSANTYFYDVKTGVQIEDDHLPFLAAGIPVVHLIPERFPKVWHNINDIEAALDNKTIVDLFNIILCAIQKWPGDAIKEGLVLLLSYL